jgi:endonuclease III
MPTAGPSRRGKAESLAVPAILRTLRAHYGKPPGPISADPFELILWEQVAYLAPDAQRKSAYGALAARVGLEPAAIAAARAAQLTAIARLGGSIAAPTRAQRMRRSAQLVLEKWRGELRTALKLPLPQARKALASFAMIGEPGADKILAFTGAARLIPLDSNGLRVLERLGIAADPGDYRRAYRNAQAALAPATPRTRQGCVDAYYLLRRHGQELCRRNEPRCPDCPLRSGCPTGRSTA